MTLHHLENASYLYSASGEDGINWRQVHSEAETSQQVISELARINDKLADVPHNEAGLDVPRITSFLNRYGLITKPFVGVDEAGKKAINEVLNCPDKTTQLAGYVPNLDFIYVLRGSREAAQSPEVSEANIVHEQFHSNQSFQNILTYKGESSQSRIGYYMLRNGFVVHMQSFGNTTEVERSAQIPQNRKYGNYFEEGGAQFMQHLYVTKELGLSNGFLDRSDPQEINEKVDESTSASYLLPGSYLSSANGELIWHNSAHAAFGLQLLVAKDPAIFRAMLEARSTTAGLREFAGRIAALGHGIYRSLSECTYGQTQFAEATHYIIERLYDGDPVKALDAVTKEHFRGLMAA